MALLARGNFFWRARDHDLSARDAALGLATMCIGIGQDITTILERF